MRPRSSRPLEKNSIKSPGAVSYVVGSSSVASSIVYAMLSNQGYDERDLYLSMVLIFAVFIVLNSIFYFSNRVDLERIVRDGKVTKERAFVLIFGNKLTRLIRLIWRLVK